MTIRFLIENLHPGAALTATSAALAIENTQDSRRAYVWRSTGLATQTIVGTIAGGGYASGVAIARHNLTSLATVQLVLKLAGATVYDSGSISAGAAFIPAGVWRAGIDGYGAAYNDAMEPKITDLWFADAFFDEYQITLADPANPAGFLEVGQIMLGLAFQPAYGMSWGVSLEWLDNAEHVRTDGGSLRSEGTGAKHRRMALGLDWLNDDDRTRLTLDFYVGGKNADIYISAYPGTGGMQEIEHAFVARRIDDLRFIHPFANNWQTSLIFEET